MNITVFPENEVFMVKMLSILDKENKGISKNDFLCKIVKFQKITGVKYFYIIYVDYVEDKKIINSPTFESELKNIINKLNFITITDEDKIKLSNWGKLFANSIVLPVREIEYIEKILLNN